MIRRLLDYLLGPRCSKCEKRAAGFALRDVRCSGKTIEVRSAPEPMCTDHLREFTEQADEKVDEEGDHSGHSAVRPPARLLRPDGP